MRKIIKEKISYLQSNLLVVPHGHFFRHGGVSKFPFSSLNTSLSVGDYEKHVRENRRRVAAVLGFEKCVVGHSVHGATVAQVTEKSQRVVLNCDGLVTDVTGTCLLLTHADCQVALFHDPVKKAVGAAHAGWRGSCQNIYRALLEKMRVAFGTDPADVRVSISPSLGPNRAEFIHFRKELPEHFWPFQVRPHYFDFWKISQMQLQEAGVDPKHVEIAQVCTYEDCENSFSYRREGKKSGRSCSIIGLSPSIKNLQAVD